MGDEPQKPGFLKRATSAVQGEIERSREVTAEQRAVAQQRGEAAKQQGALDAAEAQRNRQSWIDAGQLFEYKVDQVRETVVGDKIPTDQLQTLLDRRAAEGWHVKSILHAQLARMGPASSGLMVVFERRVWR